MHLPGPLADWPDNDVPTGFTLLRAAVAVNDPPGRCCRDVTRPAVLHFRVRRARPEVLLANDRAGRTPDRLHVVVHDAVVANRGRRVGVAVGAGRGRVDLLQRVPRRRTRRAVLDLATRAGPADELRARLPVAAGQGLDVHLRARAGQVHAPVRRQPHVGVGRVLVDLVVDRVERTLRPPGPLADRVLAVDVERLGPRAVLVDDDVDRPLGRVQGGARRVGDAGGGAVGGLLDGDRPDRRTDGQLGRRVDAARSGRG